MDEIARLSAKDRTDLFQTAASLRGNILPALIEKDFWICWTLRRVFTLENQPTGLVFKGGTSLSKVYHAIDRFSEDVDLSFDRSALGFGGDKDPASTPTKSQTSKRLEKLSATCQKMIRTKFLPQLETEFKKALGTSPAKGSWRIELDPDDPDQQTLVFHYPKGIGERETSQPRYSRPNVRLEMGARGEQWPAEWAEVTPYAAEVVPKPFKNPSCRVKTLAAERTFWEKATILHMLYYLPSTKRLPERQSRHYYDLMKLYEKEYGKKAIADLNLLKSVATHKSIFFSSTAARYDLAVPGSLKLVPPPSRKKEFENDYEKMNEMIFGIPPSFDELMTVVDKIERKINTP